MMENQKRCKDFIENSKRTHENVYDYSKVEYVNAHTPVTIICPIHGGFLQKPVVHYNLKSGCPRCNGGTAYNLEKFIQKAQKVHKRKYGYSKVAYKNNSTPVVIECNVHGTFVQTPKVHLRGGGCPTCKGGLKDSYESFVQKAKIKHGGQYSYEFVEYVNSSTKITITCNKHGNFNKTPNAFLSGQGCPTCAKERKNSRLLSNDTFLSKAINIHGNTYTYKNSFWNGYTNKITVTCDIHGDFEKYPANFLTHGQGCPKCTDPHTSEDEREVSRFLESLGISFKNNDRSIIAPYEIDIYIPDLRIAIEYCGLRWHSEKFGKKTKEYHLNKTELCKNKGIRLITIFEDEWKQKPNIVKSILKTIMNKGEKGVYARKTIISSISWEITSTFLNTYHLQGAGAPTKIRYGAFHSGALIAVMTFSKGRAALGSKDKEYFEIVRFCTDGRIHPGIFSKLFNKFVTDYQPKHIISYADRRWFEGNSYNNVEFQLKGLTTPSYWYLPPNTRQRIHRYTLRKSELLKRGGDSKKTEWENAQNLGYDRIWDCGNYLFEKIIV